LRGAPGRYRSATRLALPPTPRLPRFTPTSHPSSLRMPGLHTYWHCLYTTVRLHIHWLAAIFAASHVSWAWGVWRLAKPHKLLPAEHWLPVQCLANGHSLTRRTTTSGVVRRGAAYSDLDGTGSLPATPARFLRHYLHLGLCLLLSRSPPPARTPPPATFPASPLCPFHDVTTHYPTRTPSTAAYPNAFRPNTARTYCLPAVATPAARGAPCVLFSTHRISVAKLTFHLQVLPAHANRRHTTTAGLRLRTGELHRTTAHTPPLVAHFYLRPPCILPSFTPRSASRASIIRLAHWRHMPAAVQTCDRIL